MSVETIIGYDAEGKNEPVLPLDTQAAGYDTQEGSAAGIEWTPAQFARHTVPYPAVHIDQDPAASDYTWDVCDMEAGAFTPQDLPGHITRARQAFTDGIRPGQRWPGVYCSLDSVTDAVTELHNAGLSDVPFHVADFSISEQEAVARVQNGSGPYPVVAYQFSDTAFSGKADTDVWSVPWLTTVSQGKETDMANGQLVTQAFIPVTVPAKSLVLYRDFVSAANPCVVRVAVHSASKGYAVSKVSVSESVPVTVSFTEPDTDAVSLERLSGPDPVGYAIV